MGACYSTCTIHVSCSMYAVTQGPCLDGCMLFYLYKTCFLFYVCSYTRTVFRWVHAILLVQDMFLVLCMQLHKDRV